jgi:hypothetical protein
MKGRKRGYGEFVAIEVVFVGWLDCLIGKDCRIVGLPGDPLLITLAIPVVLSGIGYLQFAVMAAAACG